MKTSNLDGKNAKRTTMAWNSKNGGRAAACLAALALGLGVTGAAHATMNEASHPWPFMAPHARPAQLQNLGGGAVFKAPRVVPIVFASDPQLPALTAFYAKLGASTYLPSALAEYGVGKPTILPPVVRSDTAPPATDDFAASDWIMSEIAAGALPAEDGNTVYSMIFPAGTSVIGGQVSLYNAFQVCGSLPEAATASDGTLIPFTLTALCGVNPWGLSDADFEAYSQVQVLAAAFTDPYSWVAPGYNDISWSGSVLSELTSPLVSSMCWPFAHQTPFITPPDLGYPAPRIWSNRAALHGRDPCDAASTTPSPYFNAAPELGGTAAYYGMVQGVIIPPGGEATILVRLFSDGPVAPWTLGAEERFDLTPDANHELSFTWDKPTGRNGDVRYLTIKRAPVTSGAPATNLVFGITSTQGTTVHEWLVMMGSD